MKHLLAFTAFVSLTSAALALDGLYRPDEDWAAGWDCRSIGMDGGALAIEGDMFYGVESACRLTNPVTVRGLEATLFDAECQSEGETYSYRVMFQKRGEHLLVVRPDGHSTLRECK